MFYLFLPSSSHSNLFTDFICALFELLHLPVSLNSKRKVKDPKRLNTGDVTSV